MTKFFSKNRHSYLDFEPNNLKVELALDIMIPNNCVKIYQNPLINAGAKAMTKFFFPKNSHSYLNLEPSNLKAEYAQDIIIPNIYVKLY